MGQIIWQLIVGLIVGVIARLILPGRENLPEGALGWLITALIGMAGAFLGAFIATRIWANQDTYVVGWVMSILGAIILLVIARLIFGRGTATTP